jgi:hypothetical protein
MDAVTKKMSQSGSGQAVADDHGVGSPRKGEKFRCTGCGMELQITADCHCKDPGHVHFHCCGMEMTRV